MPEPLFLMVESETADERETRRRSAGKSSGETFAATLGQLASEAAFEFVAPAEEGAEPLSIEQLRRFDAVFLSGSPLHAYDDKPEVHRQLDFMRAVFASGVPSFGSCAGLQVACVAAGGRARSAGARREVGIGRRIVASEAGRTHPLLNGRPAAWDVFAVHGDEVETLPEGATLLASNPAAAVQAAEVRSGEGVFWGVQYHPELSPGEVAAAIERQHDDLKQQGFDDADLAAQRDLLNRLHRDPHDKGARWRLGVDDQVAREELRRIELKNFLAFACGERARRG